MEDGNLRVAQRHVVLFTRQFAVMLRASIGLIPALEVLARQEDPVFARILQKVQRSVLSGLKLSQSLSLFPKVFPPGYLLMIRVAESTGNLDTCLERLAGWLERDQAIVQRVRSALSYPLFIVGLTVFLTLILVVTVLPGFISIFEELRITLPLPTRIVIALTRAALNPWCWCMLLGLFWQARLILRSQWVDPKKAARLYSGLCGIPFVGPVIALSGIIRFSYSLGALLRSGSTLASTLALSLEGSGDPRLALHSGPIQTEIREGQSLVHILQRRPELFPSTLIGMLTVGEETSQLDEIADRCASLFSEEFDWRLASLSAALEPLLIGLVSLAVGTVVLAIFLPLYSYLGTLA